MCGIFGIDSCDDASNMTYLGLYALQHRGQESAGIVSWDGAQLHLVRGMGQVPDLFGEKTLQTLPGRRSLGHTRYSTAGSSVLANAQPIVVKTSLGPLGIVHNGNLTNPLEIRKRLEGEGSIFQTTSDTEVILHLMAREPNGFRPLALGDLNGSPCFASESCAFDLLGARWVRELDPGEVAVARGGTVESFRLAQKPEPTRCVFEHVYFARPDSKVFGDSVSQARLKMGERLAREAPAVADVVVPVPDSGLFAALGYSRESGLPLEFGLIRNHYVGRTFIEPKQSIRNFGVKIKLNPVRELIGGKKIVLVDDSIVRGTTSRKIVRMIRDAGAAEIHVRITAPPTAWPCHYGIDTPTRDELIASHHTVEEIRRHIEADSLAYLSLEGMLASVNGSPDSYCTACWTGNYRVPVSKEDSRQAELFPIRVGE
ncbi:MAG TPA: amidophosphoribosyltransferase [Thermoanaerobaculia bacterium]